MARALLSGRRKLAALAAAVPLIAAGAVMTGASAAGAWHADVSATVDCKGVVNFTSTSWTTGVKGTNPKIGIYYSIDNGATKAVASDTGAKIVSANGVTYEFTQANGYKFSDHFQLTSAGKKLTVTAKALGTWGGNYVEQSSRSVTVSIPACNNGVPSANIIGPSCNAVDASVYLKNDSIADVEYSFFKDAGTTAFQKVTVGSKLSKTVKVAIGTGMKLTVKATGMADKVMDLKPATSCDLPSSAVVNPSCKADGSGWMVTFKNGATKESTFAVVLDGKAVESVVVPASKALAKTYSAKDLQVQNGKSAKLEIRMGETVLVAATVENCDSNVVASAAQKCAADASGAVVSMTNSGRLPEEFKITVDGKEYANVNLKAGESMAKVVTLTEDKKVALVVTTAHGYRFAKDFTLDCTEVSPTTVVNTTTSTTAAPTTTTAAPTTTTAAPQVLGEQITRDKLAHTGSNTVPMMVLGVVLIGLGGAILRLRRIKAQG